MAGNEAIKYERADKYKPSKVSELVTFIINVKINVYFVNKHRKIHLQILQKVVTFNTRGVLLSLQFYEWIL